ncbi:hypothetical protein GPECTOR_101g26 [Gonium pectorale]|uniref:EF-hand domain-containing protein n=1 Tax=Gonium pectorale TaxID=33097 RepID=A0A150G0Z9_GONPE|nr:hypothetical protein GPECTOR_101g26 [Gonium pectorale]|eukprot:KXZ43125.1 hypothetical protein GPECTOR_101g26 [Gonium pectorale]
MGHSRSILELDQNGDGVINADELVNMLDGVVKAREERRYMIFIIAALCVFCLLTVGAVVGLTYAVVDALKDTHVTGDTMYVKGSTVEVVRTGSAEFAVVNGVLVNRQAQANTTSSATATTASNTTATTSALPSSVMRTASAEFAVVNGVLVNRQAQANTTSSATATTASNTTATTSALPSSVMRTASYMGTPQPFTSRVDVRALMELKYLYIKGTGSVELALMVTGVARVPMEGSVLGTVVRILTSAGTITLDDTVVMFSTDTADVFAEAGFKVSRNRRVLLGFYDILGFFNFIEVWYRP